MLQWVMERNSSSFLWPVSNLTSFPLNLKEIFDENHKKHFLIILIWTKVVFVSYFFIRTFWCTHPLFNHEKRLTSPFFHTINIFEKTKKWEKLWSFHFPAKEKVEILCRRNTGHIVWPLSAFCLKCFWMKKFIEAVFVL